MAESTNQNEWIPDEDEYDANSNESDGEEIYNAEVNTSENFTQLNEDCNSLKRSLLLEIVQVLEAKSAVNYTNALALNRLMQEKLQQVRSKLLRLLEQVKQQYEANKTKLTKGMKYKQRGIGIRGAYLKGGTFYFQGNMFFKDVNCRNCPNNPDYMHRKNVEGEIFPMDFELKGRHVWSLLDKVGIVQGIKEQVIDYLEYRNSASSIALKNSIEKQISLHTEKLSNLLNKVDSDFKIDWKLISVYNLKHRHSPYSANAMWNVYLNPTLRRGAWSQTENRRLLSAVKKYNYQDWQSIAEEVGHRSDYQCFVQFHSTVCFTADKRGVKWTKSEDRRLLEVVNTYTINGVINWNAVASRFPQCTKMRCFSRYCYSIDPQISHASFTPEEDLTLLAAVEEYGENFRCIPRTLFPNRSSAQLRNRYKNTLINRHKINAWSAEDDRKLMDFVTEHGPSSWRLCSELLGNHTRTSCRTRFLTIKKFLEKNPNARIEDIPTKMRAADNLITKENWTYIITEMRNDPNVCLKSNGSKVRRKKEEKPLKPQRKKIAYVKRLRSIELKVYKFFRYAYNFQLGIEPCTRILSEPHTLALVQCACKLQLPRQKSFVLKDNALSADIATNCAVMLFYEANEIGTLAWPGYCLPPSWSTLMGFRAICIQTAQVESLASDRESTKLENTEAIPLFRQRLRVLFYKTGLLSRLDPLNIDDINTRLNRLKLQINRLSNYFQQNEESKDVSSGNNNNTFHPAAIIAQKPVRKRKLKNEKLNLNNKKAQNCANYNFYNKQAIQNE